MQLERQTSSPVFILQRHTATNVIPPPSFEGESKKYAPKIQKLVDEISQLTLLEVADLNELLKVCRKFSFVAGLFINCFDDCSDYSYGVLTAAVQQQ
jgi:hypothetical protein